MFPFGLVVVFLFLEVRATSKQWYPTVNIFNPLNRIKETPDECVGVQFMNDISFTFIDDLKTEQIILPNNGIIFLTDGGHIELNNNKRCLKVFAADYHSWFMPDSWSVDEPNSAVPYSEMIPCSYDDVYFFDYMNSAVKLDSGAEISVKSINFGNTSITQEDLDNMDERLYPWIVREDVGLGYGGSLFLYGHKCYRVDGCECHSLREQIAICNYQALFIKKEYDCYDPLQPFFECVSDQMCGGMIKFKVGARFHIEQFRKTVPSYDSVDSYVSKVIGENREIKVLFSEVNFTGKSLEAAKSFYSELFSEKYTQYYEIENPKLYLSGPPKIDTDSSVAIVFGSLLGVLLVFATIFLVYVGPLKNYSLSSRFALRAKPIYSFSSVRYNNKEDERLMFEGQSIAGSVLSLEKTFDNPMYGHHSVPSTSSSTLNDPKWEEQYNENPMYEMKTTIDDYKEVEDVK